MLAESEKIFLSDQLYQFGAEVRNLGGLSFHHQVMVWWKCGLKCWTSASDLCG
jgi:hypothetical protein